MPGTEPTASRLSLAARPPGPRSTRTRQAPQKSSIDLLTRVQRQQAYAGGASMKDASYFRARAELCLNVARLLSDRNAAERLRIEAAENVARAVALEARSGPSSSPAMGQGRSADSTTPKLADEKSKSGPPNVWKDDRHRRVVQAMIGQELGARYDLPRELPHRILTLLMQLNEQRERGKTAR
jgi:hypothetical protein